MEPDLEMQQQSDPEQLATEDADAAARTKYALGSERAETAAADSPELAAPGEPDGLPLVAEGNARVRAAYPYNLPPGSYEARPAAPEPGIPLYEVRSIIQDVLRGVGILRDRDEPRPAEIKAMPLLVIAGQATPWPVTIEALSDGTLLVEIGCQRMTEEAWKERLQDQLMVSYGNTDEVYRWKSAFHLALELARLAARDQLNEARARRRELRHHATELRRHEAMARERAAQRGAGKEAQGGAEGRLVGIPE